MDPRLRTVVIVLVGAAVGAVVAGGAISYVNASAPPAMPFSTPAGAGGSASASNSAVNVAENAGEAVSSAAPEASDRVANAAPADDRTDVSPTTDRAPDSDGPTVTVTGGEEPKPEKAPRKRPAPVVEEDASPKVSDGDGGDLRDAGGKDADGGSVR